MQEDESYLNKRGLTHFWENIDALKQDKLTAGANITIASDNTISASQPTVNNATLTIQKEGTSVGTFTANASTNSTVNIIETDPTVPAWAKASSKPTYTWTEIANRPTNVSAFTNDAGYLTSVPTATTNSLGVVQVGSGLAISSGGVLSATGGGTADDVAWGHITGTMSDQTDLTNALAAKANSADLAAVATSGDYDDLTDKPTIGTGLLTLKNNNVVIGTFSANSTSARTITVTTPTKTSDLTNDSGFLTSYTETDPIYSASPAAGITATDISSWDAKSDFSGSYNDLTDKPTIGNATLTIQKNGTSAGTFTANATSNKTINITVPTTAADVSALPASTKYGASIAVSINTTDYKVTTTLKDQDGNTLGTAQVIDLPLESVVVNGSYDSTNKKIVLTLQNGNTIDIPVGDLVAGLQSEITSTNKLASDLVDDTNQTHKFVTAAQITKLNGIATGAEVNQNAFSNVKVGSTTVAADTKTDTLELVAGSNVTLTPDATNDKVTIAATDTTYSDATTSASGLMSASDKTKLNGIATGAEVNVQSDWNQTTTTADDYIKNKPTIPTVNNATLTITQNGTSVGTFTANASSNKTIALTDTTYSAGTNIDITSNTIKTKTLGVEYIIGTQSASTNAWTGVSTDTGCSSSTIYTGKVIIYHLPYAGTSTAATLNLTLPDGTTTGAKNVKYNTGSNVTTHYGAGCDIFLVFDGAYWKAAPWYDSNNYDRIRHNNVVTAAAAITSGRICVGNSGGYKIAANTITSDITYPILWAGSNVNAAATNNNFYDAYPSVNLTSTKSGWSGTANKMVFLVGTLSGTTFTVNSDVFTQTVPSSADGKVYAPIGLAYSTTQIYFLPTNTYWEYRNGAFRPISTCPTLATVATSGSYNDLSNKPTIPTVNNATLTIQKNGSTVKTFTANASSNVTANITVPTKTSDLTNDSGFVNSTAIAGKQDLLTAGDHINITGTTIKAVDYVHSEQPVATSAVTPVVTGSMISNGTITADKLASGATLKLTLSTSDIGEGAALAANTLYGVYQ